MYIIMVVPNRFPNEDAGAVRDDAFAQIYQKLGYDVFLVGKGTTERQGIYHGTNFVSIYNNCSGIKGQIDRFLNEPSRYKAIIDGWIYKYGLPSAIHINSIPENTIDYLISLAVNNNITLVHDSVEWYSACEFKWGCFDKAYILKDRLNRTVIRKPIKVYSISTYLENHFLKRGIQTCRIPVIMDIKNITPGLEQSSNKVSLIYAGSPANKDYLKEIVLGVENLDYSEKKQLDFNIFGATEKEIKSITCLNSLSSFIHAHGRVSREIVQEKLRESDFSLLLRPEEERYSKAGFPTKVVEAMAHGTAIICNITSDLGLYLKDMDNSVIVDDCSPAALTKAIRRVLVVKRDKINIIKKNARTSAENNFDYRLWIEDVRKLLL